MTEDKIMIENTEETIPEFSKAIETKTEETKAEEANEVKEETAGKVEVKKYFLGNNGFFRKSEMRI